MNRVVACDVCNTLYNSNTTFDFIGFFLLNHARHKFMLFRLLTSYWSPLFYFLLLVSKLTKRDVIRQWTLSLLKGEEAENIKVWTDRFYNVYLTPRANMSVFELLNKMKNSSTIVLVSSSIDPIISLIALKHNWMFASSVLEERSGYLTGRLRVDLTGIKHEYIARLLNQYQTNKLTVITDNQTDYALVGMADERYVIIRREEEKAFWSKLKPNFILNE